MSLYCSIFLYLSISLFLSLCLFYSCLSASYCLSVSSVSLCLCLSACLFLSLSYYIEFPFKICLFAPLSIDILLPLSPLFLPNSIPSLCVNFFCLFPTLLIFLAKTHEVSLSHLNTPSLPILSLFSQITNHL